MAECDAHWRKIALRNVLRRAEDDGFPALRAAGGAYAPGTLQVQRGIVAPEEAHFRFVYEIVVVHAICVEQPVVILAFKFRGSCGDTGRSVQQIRGERRICRQSVFIREHAFHLDGRAERAVCE